MTLATILKFVGESLFQKDWHPEGCSTVSRGLNQLVLFNALRLSRMTQHVSPRIVSCHLILSMWLNTSIQVGMIPKWRWDLWVIWRPSKLFTCPEAMVMAAADVNPAITGTDMNSITNPSCSSPNKSMMAPDRN